jgi:hypothetical protein
MRLPEQRIRLVAADPIEAGTRRLLPSVLVNTWSLQSPDKGTFNFVRLRPASIVVESESSTEWIEIPNTTENVLSTMAAAAAGIALVSSLIIAVSLFLKNPREGR